MADQKTIPRGPGQAEVTGDLSDPRSSNPTGLYRDPESGVELEHSMGAGADALARLGWKFVRPLQTKAPPQVPQEEPEEEPEPEETETAPADEPKQPVKATTPDPEEKLDDADQVEVEQDNAAGHKSEAVDGEPGVPAGDPEDLQDAKPASTTKK